MDEAIDIRKKRQMEGVIICSFLFKKEGIAQSIDTFLW